MRTSIISVLLLLFALGLSVHAQPETVTPKSVELPSTTATSEAKAPSDKVTVYVYRYKQYEGSALEPAFYCDNVKIAKADNGRYFKVLLDPGKHAFQSNDKQSGIELDLKSGEDYYIRVEIVSGMWKGHGRLVLTPKEQGTFEIKKLKPIEKTKIIDTTKAVTDL